MHAHDDAWAIHGHWGTLVTCASISWKHLDEVESSLLSLVGEGYQDQVKRKKKSVSMSSNGGWDRLATCTGLSNMNMLGINYDQRHPVLLACTPNPSPRVCCHGSHHDACQGLVMNQNVVSKRWCTYVGVACPSPLISNPVFSEYKQSLCDIDR
jgi:hypothetical protein